MNFEKNQTKADGAADPKAAVATTRSARFR